MDANIIIFICTTTLGYYLVRETSSNYRTLQNTY